MKSSRLLWTLATVITIVCAVYQRVTGPTYPVRIRQEFAGSAIRGRLERSHPGPADCPIQIQAPDPAVQGVLRWKRFKSADTWTEIPMTRKGDALQALLPHQPPAGKLQYELALSKGADELRLPGVVIRFRGDVPGPVLVVHIIAMFGGMLLSTRTGLAAWAGEKPLKPLVLWTLGFLAAGGLILGPVVQKYAFDAYWTGWPFGSDLTDNKTAAAVLFWLIAWFALGRTGSPRTWVIAAAIGTLAVFMIPHSVLGSELDYSKTPPK
jgi:hypothetical protein